VGKFEKAWIDAPNIIMPMTLKKLKTKNTTEHHTRSDREHTTRQCTRIPACSNPLKKYMSLEASPPRVVKAN
jgi:hypothetical protein